MPTYVRVHGFLTDEVEYLEEADALESFFDDADDHTDATLAEQLRLKLEATMPEVQVWALTSSVPWSGEYVLHIVSASRSTKLTFPREIEAGAAPRRAPPRGWARLGPTELAQAILGESEPFPERLKQRTDWLARITSRDVARRAMALTAARRIAVSLARDDESRAQRKALVGPVVEALAMMDDDDPARPELWDIASFLKAAVIREATLEALRRGDPALQDAHVERQRTLLFEQLPALLGDARRAALDAPWLARVEALLRRYDLVEDRAADPATTEP